MSIAFLAIVATFMIFFGFGLLFSQKHSLPLGAKLVEILAKSMLFSWLIFLSGYVFGINYFGPVFVLLTFCALGLWFIFSDQRVSVGYDSIRMNRLSLGIAIGLMAFSATVFFNYYGTTFSRWDAVVSWNRWAMELHGEQYNPLTSAYPVLWPGLWSLIYDAQQTDTVWFFAKATVSIPIFVLIFAILDKLVEGKYTTFALFLSAVAFVIFPNARFYMSGYMDLLLYVFMLLTIVTLNGAVSEFQNSDGTRNRFQSLFLTAAVLVTLATLTKQPGALLGVPVAVVGAYAVWKKSLNIGTTIIYATLCIVAAGGFLYIYLEQQSNIFGNAGILRNLAEQETDGSGLLANAFSKLFEGINKYIFVLICAIATVGLFFARNIRLILMLTYLAMGIGAFFLVAECCSYHWRNVVWVSVFAVGAAGLITEKVDRAYLQQIALPLPARVLSVRNSPAFAVTIAVAAALSVVLPNQTLISAHDEARIEEIGGPRMSKVYDVENLSRFDVVITSFSPYRFMPVLEDIPLKDCRSVSGACVSSTLGSYSNPLLIVEHWREKPETLLRYQRAMQDGTLKGLYNSDALNIYACPSIEQCKSLFAE
jgi:uncharacterized membrane protein